MTMQLTNETFIEKAKAIHGDRYDYSLVVYTASKNKVSIICPIHGIFEQEANSHINKGHGCKSCSAMVEGINRTLAAKEQFVSRANNNKYDYSLVEYTGNRYKVKIICNQHGIYEQRPQDHLQGSGCAHCSREEAGFTKTKFKEKCDKNNNGLGILYVLECFSDKRNSR